MCKQLRLTIFFDYAHQTTPYRHRAALANGRGTRFFGGPFAEGKYAVMRTPPQNDNVFSCRGFAPAPRFASANTAV